MSDARKLILYEQAAIACRVKESRIAMSLNQREAGLLLDMPQYQISLIERGVRAIKAHELPAICRAYQVELAYLLAYYEDESN